jgi:hypothetical protein
MVFSLLQNHSLSGNWWGLGGRVPANTFAGNFDFFGADGEMHLDMQGMFMNSVTFSSSAQQVITQSNVAWDLDVIFGQLNNGTNISLVTCHLANGNGLGANAQATYDAVTVVIGSHRAHNQELYYRKARFTFSGVTAADCLQHGPITWHPNNGWTLVLEGSENITDSAGNSTDLAVFEIHSAVDWHLQRFFNDIFWLQNLFSTMQGSPCAIASLDLITSDNQIESVLFRKDRKSIVVQGPNAPLISLASVQRNELEGAVLRWISADDQFRLAVYHFHSAMQFRSPKHQINLVNVSQAMEALHRAIFHGQDVHISPSDYCGLEQKLVAVVLQHLDFRADEYRAMKPEDLTAILNGIANLKQSLPNKLKYGNEKAQQRRLKELLKNANKRLPALFAPLMGTTVNFVQKIIDTRNYYIHFSDLENKRLTEMSIPFAVMALEGITFATLLLELGIDSALVEQGIRNNQRWRVWIAALRNWQQRFLTQRQFLELNAAETETTAFLRYKGRNDTDGNDLDDWLNAERQNDH